MLNILEQNKKQHNNNKGRWRNKIHWHIHQHYSTCLCHLILSSVSHHLCFHRHIKISTHSRLLKWTCVWLTGLKTQEFFELALLQASWTRSHVRLQARDTFLVLSEQRPRTTDEPASRREWAAAAEPDQGCAQRARHCARHRRTWRHAFTVYTHTGGTGMSLNEEIKKYICIFIYFILCDDAIIKPQQSPKPPEVCWTGQVILTFIKLYHREVRNTTDNCVDSAQFLSSIFK